MRCLRRAAVLGIVACVLAVGTGAQPLWQEEATEQLRYDHDCQVAYLTNVVDREVDGRHVVMARAHCIDQRAFDISRNDDFEPFKIVECELERAVC